MSMQTGISDRQKTSTSVGTGLFRHLFEALSRETTLVVWLIRFLTVFVPVVFLLVVIFQPWVEPKWMFLDPLTAAQLSGDCCHTYYGFVSMLGVMLWTLTAAICLFAAVLFFNNDNQQAGFRFSLTAGILTGWLALDDAFLVHETVMPSLGVPQNAVLAVYVILAITYLISNWRLLLSNDFWLLFVGGGALVVSMFIDTIFHSLNPLFVVLEDSAKFFGIFCWASFHVVTLAQMLMSNTAQIVRGVSDVRG